MGIPKQSAFQSATFATKFITQTNRLQPQTSARKPQLQITPRPERAARRHVPRMAEYIVEVLLDGETHQIPIDEEFTLLEGIEEYGLEVKYSCRAGVCVTCAAKVLSGTIDPGFASITEDLKDDGYVLTCSAYPRSEGIKLEMNHFDTAYNRQYGQYEKEKQVA